LVSLKTAGTLLNLGFKTQYAENGLPVCQPGASLCLFIGGYLNPSRPFWPCFLLRFGAQRFGNFLLGLLYCD